MNPDFRAHIGKVTDWLGGRSPNGSLGAELVAQFPPAGETFSALARLCREGLREGWLGQRGDDKLRWGRVIKPAADTNDYSVDVVRMTDIAGPHHAHPHGEIDMIVPLDADARFDGHGEGWLVYPPGSAHSPTVTGGSAIVLYLLPQGAIHFTERG